MRRRESGIFLALAGLMALIAFSSPSLRHPPISFLVGRQVAFTAIAALGVFFVILTGGIDLSVGSMVGLSGVTCVSHGRRFIRCWPCSWAL